MARRTKAAAGPAKKIVSAVAVMGVGGVDDDVQQKIERVDENVPLVTERLLARVVSAGSIVAPLRSAPRRLTVDDGGTRARLTSFQLERSSIRAS